MTVSPEKYTPERAGAREPAGIESAYLLLWDFDGTMFQTFVPSPDGVGVEENYDNSLSKIFGPDILSTYHRQGGLQNRAPGEVISDLLDEHPEVIELAKAHLLENRDSLTGVTPETKYLLDTWDSTPLIAATEVYIRRDLIDSLAHIGLKDREGVPWPKPTNGFIDIWRAIHDLNTSNSDFHIDTGIISSGYVKYIEEVFRVWGINDPDIWITDDQVRARKHPVGLQRRAKPAPLSIALAHQEWMNLYGLNASVLSGSPKDKSDTPRTMREWADMTKQRMFYFGDSASKDAEMARRSGIGFGLYNPDTLRPVDNGQFKEFGDWLFIEYKLRKGVASLKGAVALKTILTEES